MFFPVSAFDAIFSAATAFTLCIFPAAFNTKSAFVAKLSSTAGRAHITLFTKVFRCTFYAMCSFSAGFTPVFTMCITFRTVFPRFQSTFIAFLTFRTKFIFIAAVAFFTVQPIVCCTNYT